MPLVPSNEWGVFPNLVTPDENTYTFLENVLSEVVDLFPGTYVHIGGDEAVKDQWEASARVQQRMREVGAKDEMAMQGHLVERLEKYLASHGKRLIGWDEILEAKLPAEATVMSWRGTEGGLKAAREGHDVVMSPSSDLHLDYLQTTSPNEPPGRPAAIPLKQVYGFEPVPTELEADKRQHILGLQANMWTEHTRTFERLQHNVFPRLAAVAETGWSPREQKDYASFLQRLPAQLQRYRDAGIGYAQTPFQVDAVAEQDRTAGTAKAVSYTHLDVYKRQAWNSLMKMTDVTVDGGVITGATFKNALTVYDLINRQATVDTDSYDLKATWNDERWFASTQLGSTKASGGTGRQVFGEFLNWADYSYDISGTPSLTFSGTNPFTDPSAFQIDGGYASPWHTNPPAEDNWAAGWGGNIVTKPTWDEEKYGQIDFGVRLDSPVYQIRFGAKRREHETGQSMAGVALASIAGYGNPQASQFNPRPLPDVYKRQAKPSAATKPTDT